MSLCRCDCIAARYVLAVLGSMAMGIIYGLKVNLSVAIVGMVNNTALQPSDDHVMEFPAVRLASNITASLAQSVIAPSAGDDCGEIPSDHTTHEDGPFVWSGSIQGALKSSYFWGYIVAQLPGGRIAELCSAKWVMFFSVAINVVCTILSPVCAKWHYGALLSMRILEGIGGGVTFPAMHVMLSHWAPPMERGVMSSIVYAGTALGTVVFTLVSGIIASRWGWEAIFYIEGAAAGLWLFLWAFLIADTPQKQMLMSDKERQMILSSLHQDTNEHSGGRKPPFPWKAVLTSPAFLAILVAHTCSNWGWYTVLIELPNYMKSVLKFKIAENAVLSSIPFFTMWVFSILLSKILDTLRAKNIISTTTARKVATLFASVVPMVCFIILCYIGCQRTLATALMIIAVTAIGGMFCGFLSNHLDIAPNFAGTLMAITNTCATIPGIIVPVFVGKLTQQDPTIASWRIIFWVTIVLYIIEIIFYTIFASGEEQKWNTYDINEPDESQPLRSAPLQSAPPRTAPLRSAKH